jgi:hypothetical protein
VGLLDALLGRRKVKGPAPDRLFALTTAYVDLETQQGVTTRGRAAIVFQPLGTSDFKAIVAEMEEVLKGTGDEIGSTVETSDDEFGYRWMIIRDPDLEDLAVGVNAVSDALAVGGYSERVLCAVFAFEDSTRQPIYFIYNYKRGSCRRAAPSSATPSASCRSRRRSARACRSSPSSSAGSRSGASPSNRRRPAGRAPARERSEALELRRRRDLAEQRHQRVDLVVVEHAEQLARAVGDQAAGTAERRGPLRSQREGVAAAVRGVAPALDEAYPLELVDRADEAARIEPEVPAELLLRRPVGERDCVEQGEVLRPQPDRPDPLGEAGRLGAADAGEQVGRPRSGRRARRDREGHAPSVAADTHI